MPVLNQEILINSELSHCCINHELFVNFQALKLKSHYKHFDSHWAKTLLRMIGIIYKE